MNPNLLTRQGLHCVVALFIAGLLVSCAQPVTVAPSAPASAQPTSAASASVPAAASSPTSARQYGGILRVTDTRDGQSLGYPPGMTLANSYRQASPALEPLFRFDKTGNLTPWLATDYKNDVAAKTITLTLRQGVKFHDGTDFNAQAVKWNLDQSVSKKAAGTENFNAIDVLDDYTVRIILARWDSTSTGYLAQSLGLIISPTAFQKNGEAWATIHPIGTGPFEFVSWDKDVKTLYKKFAGYWQKGKPYVDGIEWLLIADAVTRQSSFQAGESDLMVTTSAKDVAPLEKAGFVATRGKAGSGSAGLVPDSANPKSPFANLQVRQAAVHAIDTKAIVDTLYGSEAEPSNQYAYRGHWGYNPAVVGYPYDPQKAKRLLAEAGYPNGFKKTMTYLATSPEAEQVHTAVQGYLKVVGIDATLDPAPQNRFVQMVQSGKWEGIIGGPASSTPDLAAALDQRYSGKPTWNGLMLAPDDYLKTIQDATAAPDFETKQKSIQEAERLLVDKYCLVIQIYTQFSTAVSYSTVRDHGFYSSPFIGQWTPEDVWLSKK